MRLCLLPLLALAGACRTIETKSTVRPPPAEVRVGQRARAWDVMHAGTSVGHVVLFQDRGRIGDSIYIVRNVWHQDLGLIDGLGRAYRYLPHHKEPAWIGSGTIELGAKRILALEEACQLVEVERLPEAGSSPTAVAENAPEETAEEPRTSAPTPASSPAAPDEGLPQSL
ncbi:MAG: hypothetical protein ABL998_05775 [Planctomycetota bacterium]